MDHATKLGYARMYRNKSSRQAADFLYHLRYLVDHLIENLQTDNGSEFALEFERATTKLGIQRYFSRVKTPKDNPEIERFNQTLEYEWLYITSTVHTNRLAISPQWSILKKNLLKSTVQCYLHDRQSLVKVIKYE